MANAKGRLKAPKSASTSRGKRGKGKKSSTDVKDTSEQPDVVMKRPSGLKLLTPEEKVQFFLQNGHLIKDKLISKTKINNVGKAKKDQMAITKESLMTRSGRIKKKRKENFKLIDNILKSELMIEDDNKRKGKSKCKDSMTNNNDTEISDQNKTDSGSSSDSTNSLDANKKYSKNRQRNYKQAKNNKGRKDNKSEEETAKRVSKTKQVTLSNGLVLTLTLFQCDYCQKQFSSKSSLRRHIYMHLNLKPYACNHCPKKFRQRGNLKIHMNKLHLDVHNPEGYVCNKCDKPFLLKENLALHLASHVKNENSYRCVYCGKRFSHHLLLIQHEKQHLVTGRFQCSICSMSYDCRSRLALHVKSHLKIKDFVCQYCGKEFLRPNSIRRHVQISHGGFRIQCPICKKKLKGHLTEHMRTHDKKRPHECPDCGQRFTQSTQLNVHRRSHTGDRPYPCRICGRPFSHSNALMLHIRRHTGEKPFTCAMCPLSFSQLPHMKAHMRKIHGKENPYKCEKCKQFFKLKVHLEAHAKTCTVGDRELSFEEQIQASVQIEEVEVESVMNISRMRFLLALLLTMIATKEKLKYLGFNKRLIDDLLVESLEAMGHTPCKDEYLSPLKRLKRNIEILLNGTVPKEQMEKFRKENKTTEELLVLLTGEKKNY